MIDCGEKRRPAGISGRKIAHAVDHLRSQVAATALMLLRAYSGSPALIDVPVLKVLLPVSSWARRRLRSTGTSSNRFCFSINRELQRERDNGSRHRAIGIGGILLQQYQELAELHDLIDAKMGLLEHARDRRIEAGQLG